MTDVEKQASRQAVEAEKQVSRQLVEVEKQVSRQLAEAEKQVSRQAIEADGSRTLPEEMETGVEMTLAKAVVQVKKGRKRQSETYTIRMNNQM